MRDYKIVVLGAGGVGKSSLTVQYVQGVYVESYDPTIEDSYKKATTIDSRQCSLEILDTAGVEQFTAMRELYIKNGEGFILVYSVTNEESLKELHELRQQIIRVKDNVNIPIVLVANKCDLEKDRTISPQQGVSVAESWGKVPFYETSAKFRSNVDEIFIDLVRQIMRRDSAFSPFGSRGQSLDENSKQILASISANADNNNSHHLRQKSSTGDASFGNPNKSHSPASSLTIHHTLPAQKSKRLKSKQTRKGSLAKAAAAGSAEKGDKDCIIM